MISQSQFLCLFLLACSIYCSPYHNYVNLSSQTLSEMTQSQLSSSNSEVLAWGSENIYKCVNLQDKYFDTMGYQTTISKKFTNLAIHNNIYITFDVVFMNIAPGNPLKHGQVDIDGNVKSFQGDVNSNNYKCMSNKPNYIDGTTSVGLFFSHSSRSMTISIKPTDLGQYARLGISNMNIYLYQCGPDSSFSTSSKKCECNPGYTQKETQESGNGHNYTQLQCYKK